MRRLGFYISDFGDYAGFTVLDFDDLVSRGVVRVGVLARSSARATLRSRADARRR